MEFVMTIKDYKKKFKKDYLMYWPGSKGPYPFIIPYYEIARLLNTIPGVVPVRESNLDVYPSQPAALISLKCEGLGVDELNHIQENVVDLINDYNVRNPKAKLGDEDILLIHTRSRSAISDSRFRLTRLRSASHHQVCIGILLLAIEAYLKDK
jgi:hypothetical protein